MIILASSRLQKMAKILTKQNKQKNDSRR